MNIELVLWIIISLLSILNPVLVEMQYISVDPYMRIEQAATPTFSPSYPLNTMQGGTTVGVICKSANAQFKEGDHVVGYLGWQRFARCHGNDVKLISRSDNERVPLSAYMGVLGMPGRTAWFGLMEAGKPKPGEVLVVSSAAGAVGSLVVQFGKKAGCVVVGIQGGPDKCNFVKNELRADHVVDYKQFNTPELLEAELRRLVSRPVDIYFDNVGGFITDTILPMINLRARVIICGQISQYDGGLDAPTMEPRFLHHLLYKRATVQGILARDYLHRMDEMLAIVEPWVLSGEVVYKETVVQGFERLPEALAMLFDGINTGKMVVKV